MADEKEFYRQLADVPDVPADIFYGVDRAIRNRFIVRVRYLSLAASIVLAAGVLTLLFNHSSARHPLRPEVASELLNVSDFLNGNDLESDLELYAVVEGY